VILLLHNPDEVGEGHVDCYVDKNRNGECKRVRMHWRGRFYQFSNPDITATEETRYGE
jgi:replicative DNA helicase